MPVGALRALPWDGHLHPSVHTGYPALTTSACVPTRFTTGHGPYPATSQIYPSEQGLWPQCEQAGACLGWIFCWLWMEGFCRDLWFFPRFLSASTKLELLRLVLVWQMYRVCRIVSQLCTGGRSVKNLISLYLGESFSFLNMPFFRIKLTWGSYKCCTLWRGEDRQARAMCMEGTALPYRPGIVEGEHLHRAMNCTILLFLKRSSQQARQKQRL